MRIFDSQQRGLTRVERSARARRRRARAHLDRVQRQREEPRSARPARRTGLLVLALSLCAGALSAQAWRREATLQSLAVQGLQRVSAAEIAARSGLAPGTPLAEVDAQALAARLAEDGWIESVRALRLPTGRVLVKVQEREPAALLVGETPLAVDASGVPFAPLGAAAGAGLPRIASARAPQPGAASPELAGAVALARRVAALGLPEAQEIGVAAPEDPRGYSLRLAGLAPLVVLGRDDLDARLADLARLLDAALPALGRAQQVDLRFRDQAVLDVPPPAGAEQAAASHGAATPSNQGRAG
jgi:cell division protein FtsQ